MADLIETLHDHDPAAQVAWLQSLPELVRLNIERINRKAKGTL